MWTTYISIIILIIFFSFFIKVKFSTTTKRSPDDVSDLSGNYVFNDITSSDVARFNEMKFAYHHFANFVLLEKRPFEERNFSGEQTTNMLITSEGDKTKNYQFKNPSSVTTIQDSSKSACYDMCSNDPYGACNAWKFDENQTCNLYKRLTEPPIPDSQKSDNVYYGYIRRAGDEWALNDLSELPNSKTFFKETAKLVSEFGGAPLELTTRADNIIGNDTIPYCYRTEPTEDKDAGSEYQKYIDERTSVFESFEKVCEYFLFMGNNNIANNVEFIRYAVGCTKILNEFYEQNNNNSFGTLFTDGFYAYIQKAFFYFLDYSTLSDTMYELFYEADIMKEHDGYVTKQELYDFLKKGADSSAYEDCTEFEEELEKKVDNIFISYDLNNDGKLSFSEFEYGAANGVLENQPTKPELVCPGGNAPEFDYAGTANYTRNTMGTFNDDIFT